MLVSRRAHGAHHRAAFVGNYCIVSGARSGMLDASGSDLRTSFGAQFQHRLGEKSRPGSTAQAAGLLVSRRAHGAHHRAPFEGNYCIVSGAWNGVLDAGGSDQSFFRRLERFVVARGGAEPRCWHEPDYSWQVCLSLTCHRCPPPHGALVRTGMEPLLAMILTALGSDV